MDVLLFGYLWKKMLEKDKLLIYIYIYIQTFPIIFKNQKKYHLVLH